MDEPLTDQQRRKIAGQARTLHQRVDGPANVQETDPPIDPDQIISEWKARFTSDEAFRERLEKEGFTESSVREQVTRTCWPPDKDLPDWMGELESLIRYVESGEPIDRHELTEDEPTPFVEVVQAIVEYARERLLDETIPRERTSTTEDWLATRLQGACVRPLYVEFKSYVEYKDPEMARADPDDFEDPPSKYYDQFIDAVFDDGFSSICVEYPVLSRNLVRLVEYWAEAVTEVWNRLQSDKSTLREQFDVDGQVVDLEPLADDAHARGRVPVRVSFETGSVIYKPRPIDGEKAFYTILSQVDEHHPIPSFRSPKFVSRDSYGWMEVIDYRDADDQAAVERYYERAGEVLCLAYAFHFTDIQLENVIANGEYPVAIDGETLFHANIDPEAHPYKTPVAAFKTRSVLLTSLLPHSVLRPKEDGLGHIGTRVAGLGDGAKQSMSELTSSKLEATNTDVMVVGEQEATFDKTTNTPAIDGESCLPNEYIDSILRGFEQTYTTLCDLHDDDTLFSEIVDPILDEGVENRFIFRPTLRYVATLRSTSSRDVLRDGCRLTVGMEQLAAPFFGDAVESDRLWPIYEAERKALCRLDVPRFDSRPDETAIFHDGAPLDVETSESGYDRSKRRIDAMNEEDRRRQAWLIRQSLCNDGLTETPPQSPVELHGDQLQKKAVELFDQVVDARIGTADRKGWVSGFPLERGISIVPVDDSLYDGRSGIAVTAAALYEITNRDDYRDVATEAIDPVIEAIENDPQTLDLGGYRGIGSIVYALSVVADLLDESKYETHAREAIRAISDQRLAATDTHDVMTGTAGALLGLLAYHDRYGDSTVLDRAIACGDRLLDARIDVDGHQVWNELTGFAHGSAGIAYALARLGGVTDDPRYFEAVQEALAFESETYSATRHNWAKHYSVEEYADRLCHGRSGIVLARLGTSEYVDDESLLSDVHDALPAIATNEASHVDHLCCGNLGRVETLLVGARRANGDPSDARELMGRCLARRERDGILNLKTHAPEFVNPELFKGTSGVVYTLLRLSHPDELPCLPMLE